MNALSLARIMLSQTAPIRAIRTYFVNQNRDAYASMRAATDTDSTDLAALSADMGA